MHIIHPPKCSAWTEKAKMPKCTIGCPHAKCRSGCSRHQELMAESGALNTCSGPFRDTGELSAVLPTADYSHLGQPARSPCPPCIDLIWPADKEVIGWGLGIRWPWLIPLFLGRPGPGPKGQPRLILPNPLYCVALRCPLTSQCYQNTADVTPFKRVGSIHLISLQKIWHPCTTIIYIVQYTEVPLKT